MIKPISLLLGCGLVHALKQGPDQFSGTTSPIAGYYPNLGNGFIAFDVGCPSADLTSTAGHLAMAGVYSGNLTTGPSKRVSVPQSLAVYVSHAVIGGKSVRDFEWVTTLDIEHGTFTNISKFSDDCLVEMTWLAHRDIHQLAVLRIDVQAVNDCVVHFTNCSSDATSSGDLVSLGSRHNAWLNMTSFEYETAVPELPGGSTIGVQILRDEFPSFLSSDSPPALVRLLASTSAWKSHHDFNDQVQRLHRTGLLSNWSVLLEKHCAAWRHLWTSGIEITGNTTLASAVNTSLYYILSAVDEQSSYSVSPGGLAKVSYNGHVFWDCETWMFPAMVPFAAFRGIVSSFLDYRIARLSAAVSRAEERGWEGAMLPWESAVTGFDVTPTGNIEGDYEIHVTADVPLAMKTYNLWTGDATWLLEKAWPYVVQCVEFFVSRVSCVDGSESQEQCGQYSYLNVQPPDEHAGVVNTSIYTNAAAKQLLLWAADVASLVAPNGTEKSACWKFIADRLILPTSTELKEANGMAVHPEYQGYAGQAINQADAVLLQFPLGLPMDLQLAFNDLVYYEARTSVLDNETHAFYTGDSSYSIAYLNLWRKRFQTVDPGDDLMERANKQFQAAFDHMDTENYYVWREITDGGHLNFITGAGGFLQNVLYGYGGLDVSDGTLAFEPVLPPVGVTEIKLRGVNFREVKLSLAFDGKFITVDNLTPITVIIQGYDQYEKLINSETLTNGTVSIFCKRVEIKLL